MNDIFLKRSSVRDFSDREVSEEQIKEILSAAMLAPSGMHKCPWDFVVVRDKGKLKELSKIGIWQKFISQSSVSIVVVGNEKESDMWVQDCSLVAGNIYLEAANQGLGSCWANVYGKESKEELIRELLNLPSDRRILCVMAIGYPKKEVSLKDKVYLKNKVHSETW